jgi:hypothetical protein
MASSFGKRWAVRIGLTGLSLHSRLVLSPDAMNARSNYAQTPSSAGWGKCWENQIECWVAPCFW